MTDYTAHDIHRLDQAYPDALASIEHLAGDPAHKRRLTEAGAEVYAAELTRELAATFTNPLSLAGWAAVATTRLMEAGKAWEEDTEMAWAKVDQLTAERDAAREHANTARAEAAQALRALDQANTALAEIAVLCKCSDEFCPSAIARRVLTAKAEVAS